MNRLLALAAMVLGVIGVIIGGVFIGQGMAKQNFIVHRMETEKVSLALDPTRPNVYTRIDDAADAQKAADTIASHRRGIAPTYQELLGAGRFDPTNPQHLTYAQAMNLENYLYLAVTAFGLIQVVLATGGFMIITGLALAGVGLALWRLSARG